MVLEEKTKLSEDWAEIDSVIVFGCGNVLGEIVDYISKDIRIECILENNAQKCGKIFHGIPVVHFGDYSRECNADSKIVISTGGRNAVAIKEDLNKLGKREYEDYCTIEYFILEWFRTNRNKRCLLEVHTSITTRCTLKCRKCNMFMPHYKKQYDYSVQDIQEDLGQLFRNVDFIFSYKLLGGEPLLNKELAGILQMIGEKHRRKIGRLGIISNGMITPTEESLSIMKENDVWMYLSDYTEVVSYRERFEKTRERLEKYGIPTIISKDMRWCDFVFPEKEELMTGSIRAHMLNCSPIFHGLNDKKYYYCHIAWSADKAGLWEEQDGDCVQLSKVEDYDQLKYHSLGESPSGYTSLCGVCRGCGFDNNKLVEAGQQIK